MRSPRAQNDRLNVLLHGCNGAMGGVVTRIVATADDACIACGIDARTVPKDGLRRPYPIHRSLAAVSEPVDVAIDYLPVWYLRPLISFCVSHRIALVTGTSGMNEGDRQLLRHATEIIPVISAGSRDLPGQSALLAARFLVGRAPGRYDIDQVLDALDLTSASTAG